MTNREEILALADWLESRYGVVCPTLVMFRGPPPCCVFKTKHPAPNTHLGGYCHWDANPPYIVLWDGDPDPSHCLAHEYHHYMASKAGEIHPPCESPDSEVEKRIDRLAERDLEEFRSSQPQL